MERMKLICVNIGALKSRNLKLVEDDIKAVVEASGSKLVRLSLKLVY